MEGQSHEPRIVGGVSKLEKARESPLEAPGGIQPWGHPAQGDPLKTCDFQSCSTLVCTH